MRKHETKNKGITSENAVSIKVSKKGAKTRETLVAAIFDLIKERIFKNQEEREYESPQRRTYAG